MPTSGLICVNDGENGRRLEKIWKAERDLTVGLCLWAPKESNGRVFKTYKKTPDLYYFREQNFLNKSKFFR